MQTAQTTKMKAILRYSGSKWRVAKWIISHFPEHQIYIEPFFGSGAVFFSKEASKHEIINDLDGQVINLFRVMREHPEELAQAVSLTPYAREEFLEIEKQLIEENYTGDAVEDARRFLVRSWQGFRGKMTGRSGWQTSRSGNAGNPAKYWDSIPERIGFAAERLKHAQIESMPALDLIRQCNKPETLVYADPPYIVKGRGKMYHCEMQEDAQHIELLNALQGYRGSVILSGYDNELYNDMLPGWFKASKDTMNRLSKKRTEVIWMNFNPFFPEGHPGHLQ